MQKKNNHRNLYTRGSAIKQENDEREKELQMLVEQNKKYFTREKKEEENNFNDKDA